MINIKELDYQKLRVFTALFEERSVTRAAQRLDLTQPTVSAVLKKLRELFADPLFLRGQRGVKPTARAEEMAPLVRDIIGRIEALGEEPGFDPQSESRVFSINARDFSQMVIVAPFVQMLEQKYPLAAVAIHALPMPEMVDQMANGGIDLSISSLRYAPPNLHQRVIHEEEYVCIVDVASPLARKKSLQPADLQNHDHVSAAALSLTIGDPMDEMFERLGVTRTVKVAVPGYQLIPRILQGTDYLAIVPASLARISSFPVKAFRVPIDLPKITIALLWHSRVHRQAANRWLRDSLNTLCDDVLHGTKPEIV